MTSNTKSILGVCLACFMLTDSDLASTSVVEALREGNSTAGVEYVTRDIGLLG
jgi:hypothetical protein